MWRLLAGWLAGPLAPLFHAVTLCLYSYLAILLVDTPGCQHVLSFIFYLYTLQPNLDWSCLEEQVLWSGGGARERLVQPTTIALLSIFSMLPPIPNQQESKYRMSLFQSWCKARPVVKEGFICRL
jgi:hypothetical protein